MHARHTYTHTGLTTLYHTRRPFHQNPDAPVGHLPLANLSCFRKNMQPVGTFTCHAAGWSG